MLEQLVGQTLDRYEVVQLLGEGGMGAVFRARDITLQRDVALKVMQPQAARLPNFQERFLQEARTAARLDHPGIVKVFDFGQAQGLLYIVMEYIRGDNLRRMVDDLKAAGRVLALPEAVQLVRQVCLALDYAHRQGILHRDIKPDNIMLKPEPADGLPYRPVLTDLGLAKLLEGGMMTVEGTSMGTPSYMSPEQSMGEKTDARSDVYSLGILLYELAVGRLPFPIKTLTEAIRYHTKEPPPPPRSIRPDLPAPVEQVILRALQKDPAARFGDAAAMAQALQGAQAAPRAEPGQITIQGEPTGLMTQYEQSVSRPRGPSILNEFPQAPPDLSRDRLSILAPDGSVRAFQFAGDEATIGRGPDNSLVLDDAKVSRQHARIRFDGTDYKVTDLNSTNGTLLGSARLLPGVPEAWTPDKALRIGDSWLRLERASQQPGRVSPGVTGVATGPGQPPSGAGAGRVAAFVEAPELSVEPGSATTATVTILNQGTVVDHFQVAVAGLPDNWVPVRPSLIRLLPGARQAVTVVIQPPRSPQSRAGVYPVTFRVSSQDAPDQVAEAQVRLTVGPYAQLKGELKPQAVQAGKKVQVLIENQGNAPQSVSVAWQDRAEELSFEPPKAEVTVAEGQTGLVEYRAAPRSRRWLGGRKSHPFTARLAPAGGEAQVLSGEVITRGLIPAWLPPLLVLPVLALCAFLIMFITRRPVIASITVEPPNPVAGQPLTVHWVVENAQSVELRPLASGLEPRSGEYTIAQGLDAETSLTLVAHNRFGSTEQPLAIGIVVPTPLPTEEAAPPVVDEWSVFPTTVTKGQPVTIRWRVSNAESVTLQPLGTVDSEGETTDTPQQTLRYVLIATNQGKMVEKTQEVVVEEPLPGAPVVSTFTAEPTTVVRGEGGTVRLSWDTQNADSVAIEPGIGPVGTVGYRDLPAPAGDTVYTLVARNAGGETRAEAQVAVLDPTVTPSPTPTVTPTPAPTWKHAYQLKSNRTVFHLRLTDAGAITARATWSGTQSDLALMINGPGQVGYYARVDGPSGTQVTYNVTEADLAKGDEWRLTLGSFGSGKASGTVQITYPSGSSVSPFADNFSVQPDYARSVSVIVVKRLLLNASGTIDARASWTGTPAQLSLMLNGPESLFTRQDGASPLRATFAASDADLDRGDTWRVSLVSFEETNTNAQGEIELYYPYLFLMRIVPRVPSG